MKLYRIKKSFIVLLICLLHGILVGCASAGPPPHSVDGYSFSVGETAAETAMKMVGKPYRYRGDRPSGFDCSGLVRYSYRSAGLNVPHGTYDLRRESKAIPMSDLRRGDLLFFDEGSRKSSHVGIYVGDNRFVHAPSTGKKVRVDSLDDPYWKKHFLDARRFD